MHSRTKRTLKILIADDDYFGLLATAERPAFEVNLGHRVCGNVELLQASECLAVLGDQKLVGAAVGPSRETDNNLIVSREVAGARGGNGNANLARHFIPRADLRLNAVNDLIAQGFRRLGGLSLPWPPVESAFARLRVNPFGMPLLNT